MQEDLMESDIRIRDVVFLAYATSRSARGVAHGTGHPVSESSPIRLTVDAVTELAYFAADESSAEEE